jgi:hypothetical protein
VAKEAYLGFSYSDMMKQTDQEMNVIRKDHLSQFLGGGGNVGKGHSPHQEALDFGDSQKEQAESRVKVFMWFLWGRMGEAG